MPDVTASPLTARRLALYGSVSVLAALAVVIKAFRDRANFYSAAVWLGRSNGCMLVLFNFGVFLTLVFGKACQAIFFGSLRPIEVEHLYERSWYAVTETLLAMTIFRDEFDATFIVLFGTLLFLKVFHWLCADRVELMEQSPSISRLFHARMISVLWTLLCLDLFLVAFAVEVLILDKQRMGIMIMFASEFMILTATLISTIAKYIIGWIDMRSEDPWEGKSMWISAVDLGTDFLKLATYLCFFSLVLTYYGLPLNIVRDVYVTGRSFFGRIRDLIRYRAATRNMDTRFPNATPEDLSRTDATCIICREEMVAADGDSAGDTAAAEAGPATTASSGLNDTPKKLVCGHIFHFHCLRSWLERQQSCPTCRRTVFETQAPEAQAAPAPPVPPGQPATPNNDIPSIARDGQAGQSETSDDAPRTSSNQQPHAEPVSPGRPPTVPSPTTLAADAQSPRSHPGLNQIAPTETQRHLRNLIERALNKPVHSTIQTQARPSYVPNEAHSAFAPSQSSVTGRWLPPPPESLRLPESLLPPRSAPTSAPVEHDVSPPPATTLKDPTSALPEEAAVAQPTEHSSSVDESVDPLDPRAAARTAALKRFGGGTPAQASSSRLANARQESLPSQMYPHPRPPAGANEPFAHSLSHHDAGVREEPLSAAQLALLSQPNRRALEAQTKVLERTQQALWRVQQDLARALSAMPSFPLHSDEDSQNRVDLTTASSEQSSDQGPLALRRDVAGDGEDNVQVLRDGVPTQSVREDDGDHSQLSAEAKGKRAAEGLNAEPTRPSAAAPLSTQADG